MAVQQKVLIGATSLAAVAAIALAVSSSVFAESANGQNGLADKLATIFNLNRDDVESAIGEYHTERQQERQQERIAELQQAVDDGTLTSEQKTYLENAMKEEQAEREEVRAWAEENGIDLRYIMPRGHGNWGDDRLQAAVDNGDITAEQKKLIEQKQDELQKQHEEHRIEMQQWAEDNDVDLQALHNGEGHGPGEGGGRHGGGRL